MDLKTLYIRRKNALENAEKFKDDKRKYNSFIKLSKNIDEEISNLEITNSQNISLENTDISSTSSEIKTNVEKEIELYIRIYITHGFSNFPQLNNHITGNNLWDLFPNIRL
ncbi:hypothetical protein [Arcobacter sp. YIC-310]|uniref:hypothetical protein n=1 Tax=Arcobacter sp. YIC-310 TaxID=3376632 RepID=UPI003C1591DA